jgi:hypothetical protein
MPATAAFSTGKKRGACYNKTLTIASIETIFRVNPGEVFQLAGQENVPAA